MNSIEINKHFKKYSCYIGTYACNQLPSKFITKRPFAIIMNTDPIEKPGQHWVAIFVDKQNHAEYFDSFGFAPLNKEVYKFFARQDINRFIHNEIQYQGANAVTCGSYCVTFLKLRCQNISFADIIVLDFNVKLIKKFI